MLSGCKDGLGQEITPGSKLLGVNSSGPTIYTVDSVTYFRDGGFKVSVEGRYGNIKLKRLSRYVKVGQEGDNNRLVVPQGALAALVS